MTLVLLNHVFTRHSAFNLCISDRYVNYVAMKNTCFQSINYGGPFPPMRFLKREKKDPVGHGLKLSQNSDFESQNDFLS